MARYPAMTTLACKTFRDTFAAVAEGRAGLAMIPIENSAAGRVADIHQLLPQSDLHIVAEHFERVRHNLLACPGAAVSELATVRSHVHALSQCRRLIDRLGLTPVVHADTAGAAAEVAAAGDPSQAAIASRLAAETYGLAIVEADVEDEDHNTTRFVVLAREPLDPGTGGGPTITSFMFECRNVPAALYKCLGGFATNGVNMTAGKLHGGRQLLGDGLHGRGGGPSKRYRAQARAGRARLLTRGGSHHGRLPGPPLPPESAANRR